MCEVLVGATVKLTTVLNHGPGFFSTSLESLENSMELYIYAIRLENQLKDISLWGRKCAQMFFIQ